MVGNHVADIVSRYGADGAAVPVALSDSIAGRQGDDYHQHGKAGGAHTDVVPDEVIDRFCLIGPVDQQVARLDELKALGVDQFALYLQHDAKDATLAAYGERVIPARNPPSVRDLVTSGPEDGSRASVPRRLFPLVRYTAYGGIPHTDRQQGPS